MDVQTLPLNPADYARPELLPGRPLILGGGEWMIPVPELWMGRSKASPTGVRIQYGFNGVVDLEFSRMRAAYEDEDIDTWIKAEFEMYEHLLRLQYPGLTDEMIEGLLVFSVSPASFDPTRQAFLDIIRGVNGEKTQAATSNLL
jgi:hypothetical protein